MQLVIAEKPSVGVAPAKALGVTEKKDGYIEGCGSPVATSEHEKCSEAPTEPTGETGYIVSWCVGHLVSLANTDIYDEKFKKWDIADLPIIPDKWQFIIAEDKDKQFGILRQLMDDSRVTEVVNACDAGREGELIFRLVYNKALCNKPIKRLWISSMEEKAIREGFDNLRDGKDYENLYQSALCRAKADWIVGINATRLFSKLYNRTLNVGRVQTPTLAMLYERENSIRNFQKEKYFNVHLKSVGFDAVHEKVKEQGEAENIRRDCDGKEAIVKSVKTERKTVNPPHLYDLTTLQREANRLYGFTAQQTLDYTQSLYEMKLVTYPRTDSQYITDDMDDTARSIAESVAGKFPHFSGIVIAPETKRVINNKKVSDHHAIIPTAEVSSTDLSSVPDGERKILYLIANRLLCATNEPYIYETVTAEISCSSYSFVAKGRNVISEGWKSIEKAFRDFQKCKDDTEENVETLALTEGQVIERPVSEVSEHYTQPPKHFTEDTLLSAMERAGTDEITEEVERSGLGTPATRASIIEKLTKSGFIKREKKNLVVTDNGTDLISVMPDIIKSASMTADWENALSLMAQGKFTSQQFMVDIEKLVDDIIAVAKESVDESKVSRNGGEVIGTCPRCSKNVVATPKAYSCEDRNCGFVIWKNDKFFKKARKPLTKEMAVSLIKNGKIAVKGLYSEKSGKNYDATVCLDDTGKYVNYKLEFTPRKKKK